MLIVYVTLIYILWGNNVYYLRCSSSGQYCYHTITLIKKRTRDNYAMAFVFLHLANYIASASKDDGIDTFIGKVEMMLLVLCCWR